MAGSEEVGQMSARPRLTKDELEAWRAHPVTEIVHLYLRDYAQYIREQWAEGQNWTDEARFQVQNLEDLAELDLDSIETFYAREEGYEQDSNSPGSGGSRRSGGNGIPDHQRYGY